MKISYLFIMILLSACGGGFSCPDGAQVIGAAPPENHLQWCGRSEYGVVTKHGPFKEWYRSGSRKAVGQYENNIKVGDWTCFKDGSPDGVDQVWENGALKKGDPCP